jgi:hypothetical protein
MIAKIKLITTDRNNEETRHNVYQRPIVWTREDIQPAVGTTVIIPQGATESFRFYITHIVADLRDADYGKAIGDLTVLKGDSTVIVDRRIFRYQYGREKIEMETLAAQLEAFRWLHWEKEE